MAMLLLQIKIALRNLWGSRRRTALSLLILVIGTTVLLVAAGYVEFVKTGYAEQVINSDTGHFQIYARGFLRHEGDDNAVSKDMLSADDYQKIKDKLYTMPEVTSVSARINFTGLLGSKDGTSSTVAVIQAGEVDTEITRHASQPLLKGKYLSLSDKYSVVLGKGLASSLGLDVGDSTQLMTSTQGGGIEAIIVNVGGIMDFGIRDLNNRLMIMDIAAAQELLLTTSVQRILVNIDATKNLPRVYSEFKNSTTSNNFNIDTRLWNEVDLQVEQVINMFNGQLGIMTLLLLIIFIIAVASSLTMIVFERYPEIGTQRAIGRSEAEIIITILIEGFLLGVLAFILTFVLSLLLAAIINHAGYRLPPYPGQTLGTPFNILLTQAVFIKYAVIQILCASLGALPSAVQAARVNIITALRRAQ